MDKLVFPGDFITTIEEFLSGEGVFEKNGKLYSHALGIVKKDLKERIVDIELIKKPRSYMKKGDSVIGYVSNVGRNLVEVSIVYNETRDVEASLPGFILLRRKDESKPIDFIKPTDFLKARVMANEGAIILSLKGREYGLIYSECPNCLIPMQNVSFNILKCKECGYSVKTKVSSYYMFKNSIEHKR